MLTFRRCHLESARRAPMDRMMSRRLVLCFVVAAGSVLALPAGEEPSNGTLSQAVSNDNATRVAMYWRHMIGRHPQAAARASMYWRVLSIEDPMGAADAAMEYRKLTATDPEEMVKSAFFYQRMSGRSADYAMLADKYWRKMAAHDPEVTARSAMYWRNNPDTAMYW